MPHVIEPSIGVDRLMLAVLTSAYCTDEVGGEKRTLLKFHPRLAPIKVASYPCTNALRAASPRTTHIDHTRGGGPARRPPPSLEALELGRVHHVLAVEGAGAVQAERAERDQPYLDRAASGVGLLLCFAAAGESGEQVVVDQVPNPHPPG